MKQMRIFINLRDGQNNIVKRKTIRIINVHPSFEGIGKNGLAIRPEFNKLALSLEPTMEGFTVHDM